MSIIIQQQQRPRLRASSCEDNHKHVTFSINYSGDATRIDQLHLAVGGGGILL